MLPVLPWRKGIMLLEGTVEGPLAGKAAGESDLKNALIGGSQKILRVIQA